MNRSIHALRLHVVLIVSAANRMGMPFARARPVLSERHQTADRNVSSARSALLIKLALAKSVTIHVLVLAARMHVAKWLIITQSVAVHLASPEIRLFDAYQLKVSILNHIDRMLAFWNDIDVIVPINFMHNCSFLSCTNFLFPMLFCSSLFSSVYLALSLSCSLLLSPYSSTNGRTVEAPVVQDPVDPCVPSPCGPNSVCRAIGSTPACSCLPNYIGRAPNCRPECMLNAECPATLACVNERCTNPCVGSCGINARCTVVKHNPICECEAGFTGDPFSVCTEIIPSKHYSLVKHLQMFFFSNNTFIEKLTRWMHV